MNLLRLNLITVLLLLSSYCAFAQSGSDEIVGEWMSEQHNCAVQVYKEGNSYKAILIWFDDTDDPAHPMATRLDYKNPDKRLRNRKVLGMNVLRSLSYRSDTNSWEDGIIYDAKNGHEWNSCAKLDTDGALKVTGYWHFKFIGKSMRFKRMSPSDHMLVSR